MKKAFSMIIATLVAVSFAGVVLAAEPSTLPAGHPPVKAEVKKAKKVKKARKIVKKEAATPVATPTAAPVVK